MLKAIEGDNFPRFFCSNCQTIHYQNPNVIVGCLPIWEDQILLAKRAIEPRKGYWNIPGGFLENGETVEAGAVREVLEEACIQVEMIRLLSIFNLPRINQVYLHFLAKMPDLNFAPGIESLEVAMFKQSEIPWKEIAFASTTFCLKAYYEELKTGVEKVHIGQYQKKMGL